MAGGLLGWPEVCWDGRRSVGMDGAIPLLRHLAALSTNNHAPTAAARTTSVVLKPSARWTVFRYPLCMSSIIVAGEPIEDAFSPASSRGHWLTTRSIIQR